MFYPLNYGNAVVSKRGRSTAGKPASAGWA